MRIHFLLLMANIVLAITALASPTGKTMGEIIGVPIQSNDDGSPSGRPQAPALRLFSAFVDTDSNALFVSSRYDVGEVPVSVENLSTGEYYEYLFDSSEMAILPISCTEGFWRITLTLDTDVVYVGEFEI